jgi:hypothetical protein
MNSLIKSKWTNDPNQYDVVGGADQNKAFQEGKRLAKQRQEPVKFGFNRRQGELQDQINPDGSTEKVK